MESRQYNHRLSYCWVKSHIPIPFGQQDTVKNVFIALSVCKISRITWMLWTTFDKNRDGLSHWSLFSLLQTNPTRRSTGRTNSPGGGGTPYMKGEGMLIVSLRGANFGVWSPLGCSWQNTIVFSRKGLFRVALEEILKNYIFSIRFMYSIHVIKV